MLQDFDIRITVWIGGAALAKLPSNLAWPLKARCINCLYRRTYALP